MCFLPQAKLLQAKKEVDKFAINDKQVWISIFRFEYFLKQKDFYN